MTAGRHWKLWVDPAHAGMNLIIVTYQDLPPRGPRACGDEPQEGKVLSSIILWTPRMRG